MFDLLIKDGIVVDGTGRRRYRADVGVSGDRIVALGKLDALGKRVISADGLIVAPGFIDIHSHTDESVFANPTCESKVTQGVTTEISGNCGCSAGPRVGPQTEDSDDASELSESDIEPDWQSIGEFLSRVDRLPMTINFATLVGHGQVREVVLGYDNREPSDEEMARMRGLVAQAMEEGAFGLSTGLIYPPGCYAATEELIDLSRVAARYGGIYATHMRSEGDGLLQSVEEAIRIGRESGARVQISHHKASGHKNWGKVNESLAMIDEARSQGQDVWADQYPYLATSTGLGVMLPKWAHEGGTSALIERLRSPEVRGRLRDELIEATDHGWIGESGGWETVVIGMLRRESENRCEGLSVAEIARQAGKHPVDATLDLLLEEQGSVGMMHFVIDEQDVVTVMRHPAVVVGSDAKARATSGKLSGGLPHPRSYGTFPRVLGKYVREDGVLSLEEAVAKMTGRTARCLGISNRGVLAEGCFADITIFDPEKVADSATYACPHSHARGISHVVVNGQVVLEAGVLAEGEPNGSGRVMRRGMDC